MNFIHPYVYSPIALRKQDYRLNSYYNAFTEDDLFLNQMWDALLDKRKKLSGRYFNHGLEDFLTEEELRIIGEMDE